MNQGGGAETPFRKRRFLTVLFTDLSRSTELSFQMEAEAYAALTADLYDLYVASVEEHGGTVIQLQGDGVLACFGYPEARENDAFSAVEAALEIHRGIGDIWRETPEYPQVDVHSGVHTGLVMVQETRRGAFNIFGSAVNVAAKLSDKARAGEVLVSAASLGPGERRFELEDAAQLSVAGSKRKLKTYRVVGTADPGFRDRGRIALTPFIGREAELAAMQTAFDAANAGYLSSLLLAGQAGVGKSRLVENFVKRHLDRGIPVWAARCADSPGVEPLGPVIRLLRKIFGLGADEPAEAVQEAIEERLAALPDLDPRIGTVFESLLLPRVPGETDRPPPTLSAICNVVTDLLVSLAEDRLVIVIIDDIHWADQLSRQVFDAICRMQSGRVLLLATARAGQGGLLRNFTRMLEITPHSSREASALIDVLSPGMGQFEREKILAYSGGNALYLEELCHAFSLIETEGSDEDFARSAWLDKLIDSRFENLPPQQAEIIRIAAVIGTEVSLPLLRDLTGPGWTDGDLEELARKDFLHRNTQRTLVRFKHGITRDVIYATVPVKERAALHARIARHIHERQRSAGAALEEVCDLLAYHYNAGCDHVEAARFSEMAGRRAASISALDRARTHFSNALRAMLETGLTPETGARWLELAERLALASVYDPGRAEIELLLKAVDIAAEFGDASALCRARFWVGYLEYALGNSASALYHLKRASTEAEAIGDPELVIQVEACLGHAYASASETVRSLDFLDRNIEVKRRFRKSGRPAVSIAYSLACKGSLLGDQGDFRAAIPCFDEALEGLAGITHEVKSSVLCWKAGVLLWQGRWGEALEAAETARQVGEQVRSLYLHDIALSLATYAAWRKGFAIRGDLGAREALRALVDATRRLERGDQRLFISLNYGWMCDLAAQTGDWERLRQEAARALWRSRERDMIGLGMSFRALARGQGARFGKGTQSSERFIERAFENAQARKSRHEAAKTELLRARIAQHRGDNATADRALDAAEAAFDAMEMPWHLEQVRSLRAYA